jgi:predicted esterase
VAVAGEAELPDNAMLTLPDGDAPKAGWPTILLLHGYGVNKEDFDDFSTMLTRHGVAAISVDAPISMGGNRRSWPREGEKSYAALRPSLEFIAHDDRFNLSRVFAGGFSQGAYHSMLMGKGYPSEFAGLLIISPGGGSALPKGWRGEDIEQPLYLIYGKQEGAGIRQLVDSAATEWRDAGQRVKVESHSGGHQFPANWETVLGDAMDWLLEE